MKKVTQSVFFVASFLINSTIFGQIEQIDVKEYRFSIHVSDANDTINVQELVKFLWVDKTKVPCLNLTSLKKNGKGMRVKQIKKDGKKVDFIHEMDTLYLPGLNFSEALFEIEISLYRERTCQK